MKKKWILPGVAAAATVIALLLTVGLPAVEPGTEPNAAAGAYAERDGEGNIVIRRSALSADQVSFIRIAEDSNIELLARLGDDGGISVALGTCQSCNGSPLAYYTQEGDVLKCNNCGLTFPLAVLDAPGGGCHPLMFSSSFVQESEEEIRLNLEALLQCESLFEKVAAH